MPTWAVSASMGERDAFFVCQRLSGSSVNALTCSRGGSVSFCEHSWCCFTDNALGSITLVLGGVRCGKSRYAQTLAARHARVLLIATAREDDDEMRAKIARHRADRPAAWDTVEEALDLGGVLRERAANYDVLVIDCLTLWVANLLAEGSNERSQRAVDFYDAVSACQRPLLIVSNEVGSGIVPEYASGRLYRDVLGEVNQRVAALAGRVVLMVAGIPVPVKGALQL